MTHGHEWRTEPVTHCGVVGCGGGQVPTFTQQYGGCKYNHCGRHGNQQTLEDPGTSSRRISDDTSLHLAGNIGEQVRAQTSPDEFGFGVDVSDAILGQMLVEAVEEGAQHPTHHPHHHEESQVHRGPQVAVLVSVRTLMNDTGTKRERELPDVLSLPLRGIRIRLFTQVKPDFSYFELSEVEQPRQLERAPLVEVDPRAEEVEGERGRHGAEELRQREETA